MSCTPPERVASHGLTGGVAEQLADAMGVMS
jgi:hypothetical protein